MHVISRVSMALRFSFSTGLAIACTFSARNSLRYGPTNRMKRTCVYLNDDPILHAGSEPGLHRPGGDLLLRRSDHRNSAHSRPGRVSRLCCRHCFRHLRLGGSDWYAGRDHNGARCWRTGDGGREGDRYQVRVTTSSKNTEQALVGSRVSESPSDQLSRRGTVESLGEVGLLRTLVGLRSILWEREHERLSDRHEPWMR
jgi:hypothetical protein